MRNSIILTGRMLAASAILFAITATAGGGAATPGKKFPGVALELRPVFPGLSLERPLWMEQPNDGTGRTFVVGQKGTILVVPKGSDGKDAQTFLDITSRRPYRDNENEEGLLGFALHPQFKTNGQFYIFYSQQEATNGTVARRTVISEFKVSETNANMANMESERIVLTYPKPYFNHDGGCIAFGPDGMLYISIGDGGPVTGNDPTGNGQNTATLLGKILRIDVNGRGNAQGGGRRGGGGGGGGRGGGPTMFGIPTGAGTAAYGIPTDNPFATDPAGTLYSRYGVRREIWASGLRNVWRFSFDRENGDLYAGEVGQNLWEEINIIVKGGNYGWSVREALHPFKPGPEGAQYIDPIIEYPHGGVSAAGGKFPDHSSGNSLTGGYVYRGSKYPALKGIYIYGDYASGTIWGLRYQDKKVTDYGDLLLQPKSIGSFAEGLDGELYMLSINDGKIFTLVPAGAP